MNFDAGASNSNNGSSEKTAPKFDIEAKLEEFLNFDNDDWDEIVGNGIPLYKKLKEAGDPRLEKVANTLRNLSSTIEHSLSEAPAVKANLRKQIEEGLK